MDKEQAQIQRVDAEKIGRIEYMVEDMHHRLFGNGQPGELTKISERMDLQDKEIDKFKVSQARAKGVVWAISAMFTAVGGRELWKYFKG